MRNKVAKMICRHCEWFTECQDQGGLCAGVLETAKQILQAYLAYYRPDDAYFEAVENMLDAGFVKVVKE